ncbi:MAG: hypothetical protein ACK4K3_11500, partial [Aquabacterium sp.]
MATNLDENEVGELRALRTNARNDSIGCWEIYRWLADKLEEKDDVSLKPTIQWLRGATEANASRGAFSALIRAYTEKQFSLRIGGEAGDELMQAASDKVAENLLRDILGESLDWQIGLIPGIDRIAKADATAVGEVLFNQDIQDTAAATEQNSAWSGTLLFSILGSDQRGRLTSTGALSKIDTLSDVRDVLYACVSYAAGLKAARGAMLTQPLTDFPIIGSAIWNNYIIGPGTIDDLWATVVAGAGGSPLKSTFWLIRSIGPNRFLEMLVGAADGKSIISSIDDASFDSKARFFFQSRTSVQLKSTPATIYTTAAELGSAARTDVNARVALSALSLVSFRVYEDVASQFSLFNEGTGQCTVTQQWMKDRTEMLQWLSVKIAMGTDGPVTTTSNGPGTRYLDTSSSTEVITGTLPVDRRQFIFGGDGRPLVVSCGNQRRQSVVVVAPCGHVGKSQSGLSTCPCGLVV